MSNKLEDARRVINEVDAEMASLFVKRMRAAEAVYEYKREHGLPILDEKREREVIDRNSSLVEDGVLRGYYVDYQKHLMSLSRAYQARLQSGLGVAYSGVEGAFAHVAAGRVFPTGRLLPYGDFKEAYDAVVRGESDVAILPIENSYAGEVGQTVDLIFSGDLFINGIYELSVKQNLLGIPGATVEGIRRVVSHPQALSQCRGYLERLGVVTEEATNTALAAKQVSEGNDPTVAAIASAETASLYGLEILAANVSESGENTTRFAVLSRTRADEPSLSGTVLMFSVKHEAGSLAQAIAVIGRYGYSMTALRSRPMRKHSWQYYFYVEIDGRVDGENGAAMLRELGMLCDRLKVAGSFAPHTEL